ncbi:methylenetetrahydrofolate reductase [Egicoccus halophilus]|uniref:Methylenetetrahydrofolate reductase n=1 Tax=Egicoccus halophilus TaxID=1670830 RepID=A0A8J3EQM4_9ACTN|nr:methylenetetrahydrofolate reductase [Egicoccus halophilus]GGI02644.1 5,10-methylenetetrahydrofolate reductase [Egicoccus halophilus]
MPRIDELLAAGTTFSFEFFPPQTDAGERKLRDTLNELEPLGPSFVSVTYGAGGSTRERTHQIVVDMLERTTMTPMAHLTAVCHTRDELAAILARYRDAGVQNLLALRGDAPRDVAPFWELERAVDLVELAREVGGGQFAVGVAAHPEGHPASHDLTDDRRHLATKLAAADFGVTQFFFTVEDYLDMVEQLAGLGCDTPVVPGVMPVTNLRQIERFAELSGAVFPADLARRLHAVEDRPDEVARIGTEVATELCQRLLDAGAPGLHFYTLNSSTATREIYANLGLPVAG